MMLAKDVTKVNLDRYVTARIGPDVCSIAAPLKYIGFKHFAMHRVYPDGSRIDLTTHVEFSNYFLKEKFYELGICGIHGDYAASYLTWAQIRKDGHCSVVFDAIEEREGLEGGYTFIKPYLSFTDIIYFAMPKSKTLTIANRIDCRDLLEKFIFYFYDAGKDLIKQAEKERIFYPNDTQSNIMKYHCENKMKVEKFLKILRQEYHEKSFRLTFREKQCVEYIKLGYSAKEIAITLGISYRTVEKHIENIKSVFGVRTFPKLMSLLIRMT